MACPRLFRPVHLFPPPTCTDSPTPDPRACCLRDYRYSGWICSVLCTTYSGPGSQDRRPPTRPGPQRALHHSLTRASPTAFPPISVRLSGDDVRVPAMQCGPVNQSTSLASQSRPSRLPPQHPSPHQSSSSSSATPTLAAACTSQVRLPPRFAHPVTSRQAKLRALP